MIFTIKQCNLGYACIAIDDFSHKLCGLELGDSSEKSLFNSLIRFAKDKTVKQLNDGKLNINVSHIVERVCDDAIRVVNGEKDGNEVFTIDNLSFPYGTATFLQRKVWKTIFSLQRGEVISYKELANKAQIPSAIRAAATSCGKNPLAIVVPCHRIVKSNNDIGKYRWGDQLKKDLLRRESYNGII